MIIGIVGSRYYADYSKFKRIINKYMSSNNIDMKDLTICSGGAKGIDTMAERYAKEYNLPTIVHLPEWDKYGRAAGPLRNTLIINDSDRLVAFLHSNSVGTKDSINKARKKGIDVFIVKI